MSYLLAGLRYTLAGIIALLVLLVIALTGCTVGPKYVKASTPTPPAYKEAPPASYQGADQWRPADPADKASRGKWWEIFGDPELNGLEKQVATSKTGRHFQPGPKSLRSAVPRSSRSDSLQSSFAVSDYLHFAGRQLC